MIEELSEYVEDMTNGGGLGGYKSGGGYGSSSNQTRFFKISGYIKKIFNDDKILYLSCPDCRKKVM